MNGYSFTGSMIALAWIALVLHQLGNAAARFALSPLGIGAPIALIILTVVFWHMGNKAKDGQTAPAYEDQRED